MKLPEFMYFLRPGWWLVHIASVSVVLAAGVVVGHHLAGHDEHAHGEETTHAGHAQGDHDHTSPEVLRPLMQQMLVNSVQLQGALAKGDLARAARYADAVAGSCDDFVELDRGALPERLGPSFAERDLDLHLSARLLADALREGKPGEARSLHVDVINACQACHAQAPAAAEVDLHVLTSFGDILANTGDGSP